MSEWNFVAAAYLLSAFVIAVLALWSWRAMRRAEAAAEAARLK